MKFLLLLLFPFYALASDPVSCAPERRTPSGIAIAQVASVRDGDWFTASTWSTGKVPAITDEVEIKHMIRFPGKSFITKGRVWHRSQPGGRKAGIILTGIDTKKFVDGPTDMTKPLDPWFKTNVGIYVLDNGYLDLIGEEKTPWTRAVSGLTKGTTQFQVGEAINWKQGDEVVIAPTRTPDMEPGKEGKDDKFAPEFERRIIRAISGNTITIDALKYDHLMVDGQFTPEVANITRSFIISGEKGKETHVFINSRRPFTIKNIEIAYTGGGQKTGFYGIHAHMMYDFSRGSIISGNAAHDNNFRVFVPHMSHGITIDRNVMFDQSGESLWYDHQQPTHDCLWSRNLIMLTRLRPGIMASESINVGQGVNNIIEDNVVVYGNTTNGILSDRPAVGLGPLVENRGAITWHADNMGDPAIFRRNMVHSSMVGAWWWINSPHNAHPMEKFTAYNNWRGAFIGAYGNSVLSWDNYYFNSPVEIKASSGTDIGASYFRTTFKSDGKFKVFTDKTRKKTMTPALLYIQDSPIESWSTNKIVDCKFIGALSVMCWSPKPEGHRDKKPKRVDLINCTHTGIPYQIHSSAHKQTSVTIDPANESKHWGTGTGLLAEYYDDTDLKKKVGERVDFGIRHYSTWYFLGENVNAVKENPTGPYHKITSEKFSVRWTGFYEPQMSGLHSFEFIGSSGVRLWVAGRLILDSWVDKVKETDAVKSSAIALVQGVKIPIKVEVFNEGGKRRAWLKVNGKDIPMFQLYPAEDAPEPPPPPVNVPPVVSAGPDLEDTTLSFLIKGSAVDEGPLSVEWTKLSGGNISFQKQTNPAHLYLQDFAPGVYVFKMTVTDAGGLSASDTVKIIAREVTAPARLSAGPDTTISGTSVRLIGTGDFPTYRWQKIKGGDANIRSSSSRETDVISLKPGKYTFRLNAGGYGDDVNVTVVTKVFSSKEQTGSRTCSDGTVITHTVPAGKYTGVSQSTADAIAAQELNEVLSRCPVPVATYDLGDGRKLLIFTVGTIFKYSIN